MPPDWNSARQETIEHLQRLIRFNTTNPPGNELPLARYLTNVLSAAGIDTQLFEPASLRGAVVARLQGDGSRRPVLMMAHMDVVGVEREHWSVDPFAGEIKDGFLYGRGAIDDKGMLAANLMTMLLLAREIVARRVRLRRDVIFAATSDEEVADEWGMGWLIENHPDLVRAEFALNEGGRTRVFGGKPLYLAVQSAEKVAHVVRLTAHGPGGHASVPLEDNAVARLGRAIAAIHANPLPVRLLPTTRAFFGELSHVWPAPEERAAMADVASDDEARVGRGARVLREIPFLDALLRTTVSPTMLDGGVAPNVIPTQVSATLNIRTLPGDSIDDVIVTLARVVADPRVDFAIVDRGEDSPSCELSSPLFRAIADATRELEPQLAVVPFLGTGATDSARMRRWGVQAYGVLPFPMEQSDEERMHGNDERISLDALAFGSRLIYETILRVAGT
jgi:acetylornithine deacetylase/succinyl-diaminopimelate desuccinylase-like protein